jgi:hypothetical protein
MDGSVELIREKINKPGEAAIVVVNDGKVLDHFNLEKGLFPKERDFDLMVILITTASRKYTTLPNLVMKSGCTFRMFLILRISGCALLRLTQFCSGM